MSTKLPFHDRLLDQARRWQDLGLNHRATRLLERIADMRELPGDVVEEAHWRLAQLSADAERHARSRRHLIAAIARGPAKAEYRAEMGRLAIADPNCHDDEAVGCFEQATQLEADNPRYLCDYGALAIRIGEPEKGLGLLRQARELAPNDMDVFTALINGLVEAGETDEARRVLREETFRRRGELRAAQQQRSLRFRVAHAEQHAPVLKEEPQLLPFCRPEAATRHETDDGRILRLDAAEGHAGPRRSTPDTARNERTQHE